MSLQAFEVTVVLPNGNRHEEWCRIVNAKSRGAAKAEYYRDLRESWESIPFTAVRARSVGRPRTSAEFIRVATYRGLPDVRCGDLVLAGRSTGVIVGHNASCNFDVLFDDDAPDYAGLTMNVHPYNLTVLPAHAEASS